MAGAFDGVAANRREALWDAGLPVRPPRNGQRALPLSTGDNVPDLADFTAHERMAGEYAVMGIYPKGTRDGVREADPRCPTSCAPPTSMHCLKGQKVLVAGWPVARQHPRGMEGTVFVTIEDETGDVQLIVWPRVFARYKRELGNQRVTGQWSRLPSRRHHQCHHVQREDVGCRGPDARRPRLALR